MSTKNSVWPIPSPVLLLSWLHQHCYQYHDFTCYLFFPEHCQLGQEFS